MGNDKSYTKIFIRNLRIEMFIGIHPHEKQKPQPVIITVEARLKNDVRLDSIENTVCYETLAGAIRQQAAQAHIGLLETFAGQVADICFRDTRIADVRIKLEKPDLLGAEAVGVEIYRQTAL
jgi:dihydroneopterin aldolase